MGLPEDDVLVSVMVYREDLRSVLLAATMFRDGLIADDPMLGPIDRTLQRIGATAPAHEWRQLPPT